MPPLEPSPPSSYGLDEIHRCGERPTDTVRNKIQLLNCESQSIDSKRCARWYSKNPSSVNSHPSIRNQMRLRQLVRAR